MGCSASRLDTLLAKAIEDPTFSLSSQTSSFSSFSSSSTSSSSSSSTCNNSSALAKPRSLSAPLVHHPATCKGDSHHLVSLTSTTYGSLIVVDNHPSTAVDGGDFSPDSVINTWELMEGLEDEDDVEGKNEFNHGVGNNLKVNSLSSCDFKDSQKIPTLRLGLNVAENVKKLSDSYVFVEMAQEKFDGEEVNFSLNSKPLWKLLSEESLLSKMDPNVAASYQKALSSSKLGYNASSMLNKSVGSSPISAKSKSVECSPMVSKLGKDDNAKVASDLAGCEDKIVLYFTSLRGIRRTYEDCCTVRLILKGCRVIVDERDISMDSSYRKELQSVLGGKPMTLPQLFIRGKLLGGAEEIKQMHENGELERLLDGFPIMDGKFVCDSCGDARFIPCSNCSGSRKIFQEEEGRTMRCPNCNENGLVRCPACCS